MRDINDLVFTNQNDLDLIYIAKLFGELLNLIVNTIDKFGLKKRNLNKHHKDVERFYRKLDKCNCLSSTSEKLKHRFKRHKIKLFTFLNHDGIPWNNNNVEHAIKEVAKYRRNADGLYSENGLQDYLILLSISQTCSYQNTNFLEFLQSTDIII